MVKILGSHWTATARLKLGSPQPDSCCPATIRLLHWVHVKSQHSRWAPGLSDHLQQVSDARKTAVNNNELYRLQVDIIALQETRLPEFGIIRERLFILLGGQGS